MAKNMYILEQVISIPEVDHFLLARSQHPEIVSFRTRPTAHSSSTRCRLSIIQSNLFHQKILSCRSVFCVFFFFDRASLYNLFQMKPTSCTLLLSIFISTSLHISGNYVPIMRRTYCVYATLVIFVLYGWLSCLQTRQSPIQNEKYQCRIDTVSSDDVHIVARNM